MTVIAWDGKTLAADKRSSQSWGAHETVTKIERWSGHLLGMAASGAVALRLVEWFKAGADPEKFPAQSDSDDGGNLVVIRPDGTACYYGRGPYPTVVEDRTFVIGCGGDFAKTAMHLGKTAEEAVRIACELNSKCGNGVDTLALEA